MITHTIPPMEQHRARRLQLAEELGDAIAVIPAAVESPRNDDVDHEFRQDSDFYFLTGFDEPDAVALIDPAGPDPFVLFVRPRNRDEEIWTGHRAGIEGAREQYGADAAFPIADLGGELRRRFEAKPAIHYRIGGRLDDEVLGAMKAVQRVATRFGVGAPQSVVDPSPSLARLRQRKSAPELELLDRAAVISVDGHRAAMEATRPGVFEYQVQAAMEARFRESGSPRNGYPSIVASGPNACILHYVTNDRRMEDGDLLLIDAAAEYGYFSADITRTFPVNGRFSPAQRAVYEVVLAAEREGIAAARVGGSLKEVTDAAVAVIAAGLVDLGLVPGTADDVREMHLYREFFMHGVSHWLGMDVHDAGPYRQDRKPVPLEPGMAFTVEPGLYFEPNRDEVEFVLHSYDLDEWAERRARLGVEAAKAAEADETQDAARTTHPIPAEFRGIGVRIEDDVVIDPQGPRNLTGALPTAPDEVEAVVQG